MTSTILIIDDSEDDQRLYQRAFKDFDHFYSLVMASSAEAGFARIADAKPDLILLDYNLPDMDGLSFMKRLAASSDTPIPIVMLTGEGSTAVAVEVMKQGADDYLVKDTEGVYLRLLPGVIGRVLAAHAQHEKNLRLQKETEALLRRNQTLMQNSMDGIHVMDMSGNIVEANDAFCRMLGYTQKEMACLNVADWDVQWSAEELRERFKQLIGNSSMFETVHRRKDGALIDVEISTSGIEIEGQYFLFASSRDITERKKIEMMLKKHKLVIDSANDGFWTADSMGNLLDANEAYVTMSGYTVDELTTMHISQLDAFDQPEDVAARAASIIAHGHERFETRHRNKDGHLYDIEASVTYMPELQQFFVFCRDITDRKKTEDALRVAAVAFETHDAILITDASANIIRVNQAFTDITGYSQDEVLGKNPNIMSSGRHDKEFYSEMWQQLLHTGSWSGEILDKRKNGQIYPKWLTITAVKDERQETTHYVSIFSDITARKQAEEEIRNLAFYDSLTQLPNRRLFMDRFRAALTTSTRRNDYGAVLFVDLDRFKTLNDTLGHDYGDLLLIEVAARIKSCVREMDAVARLGGDEFVVLIEGISKDQNETLRNVGLIAEKIRATLVRPYQLKSHEHYSSPSIGISLYRGNENSVDDLLKQADIAMYQAKNAGRNAVRFFDPVM